MNALQKERKRLRSCSDRGALFPIAFVLGGEDHVALDVRQRLVPADEAELPSKAGFPCRCLSVIGGVFADRDELVIEEGAVVVEEDDVEMAVVFLLLLFFVFSFPAVLVLAAFLFPLVFLFVLGLFLLLLGFLFLFFLVLFLLDLLNGKVVSRDFPEKGFGRWYHKHDGREQRQKEMGFLHLSFLRTILSDHRINEKPFRRRARQSTIFLMNARRLL